jgi:parvulin-like peptidyl-prolyl isomerase
MNKLRNGEYVTYPDISGKKWYNNFKREIKTPEFIDIYGAKRPVTNWLEDRKMKYIEDVISWAFTWNETEQGYEYWLDIKNDVQNTMYCRGKVKDSLAKIIEDM